VSLSASRVLQNVNPALAERIRILEQIADALGSQMNYVSGYRDEEEQRILFNEVKNRPVAAPGCSQHQYGWAVDVFFFPAMNIDRFGNMVVTKGAEMFRIMNNYAQQLGLTIVSGDDGHYQIFPGGPFRDWAVASGFCNPEGNFFNPFVPTTFKEICLSEGGTWSCGMFGCRCRNPV